MNQTNQILSQPLLEKQYLEWINSIDNFNELFDKHSFILEAIKFILNKIILNFHNIYFDFLPKYLEFKYFQFFIQFISYLC